VEHREEHGADGANDHRHLTLLFRARGAHAAEDRNACARRERLWEWGRRRAPPQANLLGGLEMT
jgi:hypothetical protein